MGSSCRKVQFREAVKTKIIDLEKNKGAPKRLMQWRKNFKKQFLLQYFHFYATMPKSFTKQDKIKCWVLEIFSLIVLLRHFCHSITEADGQKMAGGGIFCMWCDGLFDPKNEDKYLHLSAKVCRAGTDYKTHLPMELHYITGWCGMVCVSCQESQCHHNLVMGRSRSIFFVKMKFELQK